MYIFFSHPSQNSPLKATEFVLEHTFDFQRNKLIFKVNFCLQIGLQKANTFHIPGHNLSFCYIWSHAKQQRKLGFQDRCNPGCRRVCRRPRKLPSIPRTGSHQWWRRFHYPLPHRLPAFGHSPLLDGVDPGPRGRSPSPWYGAGWVPLHSR